jgi:hypothetical protein
VTNANAGAGRKFHPACAAGRHGPVHPIVGGEVSGIDLRRRLSAADEEAWVAHVGETAGGGTLRSTCSSWYVGTNIPVKPRVFMPYIGGLQAYIERRETVVAKGHEGFAME